MKTKWLLLVAGAILVQNRMLAGFAEGPTVFPVEVYENGGFVRLTFYRDADEGTNLLQTVTYVTADGAAKASVDYVPAAGTLTFLPGQLEASFLVSLIDNPLADGPKGFHIATADLPKNIYPYSSSEFRSSGDVVIRDNEFPVTSVDAAFVPERWPIGEQGPKAQWIWRMPDGRVLLKGGVGGMTMLDDHGALDPAFKVTDGASGWLEPLHVFPDGTILAREWNQATNHFLRLHSDGSLAEFLAARASGSVGGRSYAFAAALPDGRLLMYAEDSARWTGQRLRRLLPDGTEDGRFNPPNNAQRLLAVVPDGKVLVELGGRNSGGTHLARLKADGSPDQSFAATFGPYEPYHYVGSVLLRASGKVLFSGALGGSSGLPSSTLGQLNADGSWDPSFQVEDTSWTLEAAMELADGRLLVIEQGLPMAHSTVRRLNLDGTFDPSFKIVFHTPIPMAGWPKLIAAGPATLLASGPFDEVDGLARRGLARLNTTSPRREFRVLATECDQAAGWARLKIVRTGNATQSAAVDYATSDGTARAGYDYTPQAGTLAFTAGEVSKELAVPLAVTPALTESRLFNLGLSHPTGGYTVAPTNAISILPPVRLTDLARRLRADGVVMIEFNVHGLLPGFQFTIEGASDVLFKNRYEDTISAVATTHRYQRLLPEEFSQFFRVRRD